MQQIVGVMLGGGDDVDGNGPDAALDRFGDRLADRDGDGRGTGQSRLGTSAEGAHASMCTDATLLPPPPFVSYNGKIDVGSDLHPPISIDFAAITLSKLGLGSRAPAEAAKTREAEPAAAAAAASRRACAARP